MTTLLTLLALLAALAWLFRRPSTRRENPVEDPDELAAAERDVRDAESEEDVRDWGPGAP